MNGTSTEEASMKPLAAPGYPLPASGLEQLREYLARAEGEHWPRQMTAEPRPVGPANEQQPEDPRSTYRRLVAELQGRIVGTQNLELIRQLALLGVGHLNGVSGNRLLLVGATGSGKTHAARCLAEAITRLICRSMPVT
jgi:chromosomal replication initiation ATPase DnaA